ncbi:hypothetical protein BpHYR1_017822 [Brachionus plicatilis]|uniref:Uncharacterized protein n=1 Tax=Brachionus plicatilis TaxID=10195 RepID=A0A3M7RMU6_BRAPC|nr:hypothetical protein BpHYR1_017822 [Brachionus plicatilis]
MLSGGRRKGGLLVLAKKNEPSVRQTLKAIGYSAICFHRRSPSRPPPQACLPACGNVLTWRDGVCCMHQSCVSVYEAAMSIKGIRYICMVEAFLADLTLNKLEHDLNFWTMYIKRERFSANLDFSSFCLLLKTFSLQMEFDLAKLAGIFVFFVSTKSSFSAGSEFDLTILRFCLHMSVPELLLLTFLAFILWPITALNWARPKYGRFTCRDC